MRTYFKKSLSLLLILSIMLSLPIAAHAASAEVYTLPVFETSDIHGHLIDVGYNDPADYQYRLAYIADIVNDIRQGHNDRTILLDGGDIYQGNVVSNLLDGQPLSAAFDAMDYDAVALGNHEFDWGIEMTTDHDGTMPDYTVDGETFENGIPIVCCNLYYAGTSNRVDFTKDYVILDKTAVSASGKTLPVKVAVIGYIPNYSSSIMATRINPYTIKTGLTQVENTAKQLKQSGQADAVVLLVHEDGEDIAGDLSYNTPIDLVCGGHSHYGQAGTSRAPYIQCSAKAQGYASAKLQFTESKTVSVTDTKHTYITDSGYYLHDTASNKDRLDASVLSVSHDSIDRVRDALTYELGYITTSVNGDQIGSNDMSSTGGNWMTDLANRATGAKVSFTNSGGIRTSFYLTNGERKITKGDIYTIAPFGNRLFVYDIYYSDLLNILNWAVGSGKGLGLRMSGIDCYYSSGKVNALVVDGVCIYKDGKWANGTANRPVRVSANEFIATSSTPFSDMAEVSSNLVDNEAFIEVLEQEKAQSGGFLYVDKQAHLIKSTYKGELDNNVFYTITTSCSEGGTITPTTQVKEGANCTVTFAPNEGWHVARLVVDKSERTIPESLSFTFTSVYNNHSVSVEFAPDEAKDPCDGYTDIDRESWYHPAADYVIQAGIMGSTQTDCLTFEPATACTRAMIVSVLFRLSGSPIVEYQDQFPDVPERQWYSDAVIWAYNQGIVSGYDTGLFGPNDHITREQMAVILMAYAKEVQCADTSARASLAGFPDEGKVTWSRDAVRWAVAEGLISGKAVDGKTLLDPQGKATRAEVASIFMRLLQK